MNDETLHFAHYEIRRREDGTPWELGRGAMGVTYKAYDSQLRIEVALKVINPAQVGDAKTQALFLREARAAARVHHGNVANVVFLNQDPTNPFYAMEFIAGESLRDWLQTRCPLEPLLAIGLAEQIAAGLGAIHAESVVHRDLKPGNVMIVRAATGRGKGGSEIDPATWQVKIIDFGLARGFAGDSLSSNVDALTTGFRGTAVYASPEQCQERTDLDGRADLYSLGCILWEMLVGTPPFRGASLQEILTLHVSRPAPLERLSHLSPGLRAVVARLLAKDPDGRFADAAAVVKALEACREKILSGAPGADEMVGSASQLETAVHAQAANSSRTSTPSTAGAARDTASAPGSKRRVLLGALGLVALAGLVGLLAGWWRRSPPGTEQAPPLATTAPAPAVASAVVPALTKGPTPTPIPEKTIAVLPFENLSSDKENAFFADGVQDQILTDLSRIADLRVTSRTSVMRYRGTADRSLREIAQALGVIYVLEGTVQRSGNKVRVTAQLIDTRTDAHLWAEKYDRDLSDVFGIQSEVATAIAGQLKAKLTPSERAAIEERPTSDLAAYDLYLRANALEQSESSMMLPETPDNLRQMARLLAEAVERDAKFLQAYCLAARVYRRMAARTKGDEKKEYLTRAEANLAAAVRLAPAAGETLVAQADYAYGVLNDRRLARESVDTALKVVPNNAGAWWLLARINHTEGRWDECNEAYRRARLLSPNDVKIIESYSFFATTMRDYDLRVALCDRGAALTTPPLRWAFEIRSAATEVHRAGDLRPAKAVRDRILAENPGPRTVQELAQHLYMIAAWDRDVPEMERAEKLLPPPRELGDRMEAARRQVEFGRVRREPAAVRRAAEGFLREVEAATSGVDGKELNNDAELLAEIGRFYALAGRKEDAIRAGMKALELTKADQNVPSQLYVLAILAQIYALTGENALALDQIEYLFRVPGGFALRFGDLLYDPDWDTLRKEPRFLTLLAAYGPKTEKK